MMTEKQKEMLVKKGVKAALYTLTTVGLFLLVSSVLDNAYITVTVNWVKCFIGLAMLFAVSRLYAWLFPKKTTKKGE